MGRRTPARPAVPLWGRPDTERGSLSIFVALCAVGFLVVIGIVIDCGGRLNTIERDDALAQEAARAGGQQIDPAAALAGGRIVADPVAAKRVAEQYLADNGVQGVATVDPGGTTIHVTVDGEYKTALLGVIGFGSLTVHGEGSASLVHGVDEAENG